MMEEINASWISSVLTADAKFHIRIYSPHFIAGNLD
jgi:hypothetical protein